MNILRSAPVTLAFAGALIAVFAYQWSSPGTYNYMTGTGRIPTVMLTYGVIPSAVRAGEWWRLVTAGFLHASVMHIAFNLWGLLYAAPFVERWYGRARLIAIFLIAVVAGDIAAAATSSERTVTVGASGGIVGLFAAVLVVGVRFWSQRDEMARGFAPLLATLINGLAPSVSNAGHIGGALGGAACAWLLGVTASMREKTLALESRAIAASADFERRLVPPRVASSDPANTITLRMSWRGYAMTLTVAFVLLAIAAVAWFDDPNPNHRDLWRLAVAVALPIVAVGIVANLRFARLQLSPGGFTVHAMFTRRHVQWRDVLPTFVVGSIGGTQTVFYRMRPEVEATRRGWGLLSAGTQRIPAIYGLTAREQAQLMADTYKKWMLSREDTASSA